MKKTVEIIFNLFFSIFRIRKNKIIFQSSPDKIDGNPYALYNYIKEKYPDKFVLKWLVTKKTDVFSIDKKDCVYSRTFAYYYHLATAKYWIRSHFNGCILKKKKKQIYLQLWHGWGNFKKCGYDIKDDLPQANRKPVEYIKECSCYLAAEKYILGTMKSSIGYNRPAEIVGMGRTDYLVNLSKTDVDSLKKKHHISSNKKVILYAPTFRDTQINASEIELPINELGKLKDYVIFYSLHPIIAQNVKLKNVPKNFIDCSSIDIYEMLIITDILITDYSSSIFDYGILQKPVIFYMYDIDEYIKLRGDFYLDYRKDLPGPIVKNEKDLVKIIQNIDKVKIEYQEKLKDFKTKYNYKNDGHVNERITNMILENHFDKYIGK